MATYDKVVNRLEELIQKATDLLNTRRPGAFGSDLVTLAVYTEWVASSRSVLIQVFDENDSTTKLFHHLADPATNTTTSVEQASGVLRSALDRVKGGWLDTLAGMVSAEVFSDFLEMADYLISQGYVHAAASLTGAVLEDGLRRIAKKHGVPIKRGDGLDDMNKALAKANVYTALVQKNVDVWRVVRNSADHGNTTAYTTADVVAMHAGVRSFLGTYL